MQPKPTAALRVAIVSPVALKVITVVGAGLVPARYDSFNESQCRAGYIPPYNVTQRQLLPSCPIQPAIAALGIDPP
jgi:hypothetical protein